MSQRGTNPPATNVDPRLASAIADAVDAGTPPPCLGVAGPLWTSERPADRLQAIDGCQPCPVLQACYEAAEHAAEPFGVWAGLDRGALRGGRQ